MGSGASKMGESFSKMTEIYPLREFEGVSLAMMPRPRAGDWLSDEVDAVQHTGEPFNLETSLVDPGLFMSSSSCSLRCGV
jgi:hypothetical protein